MLIVLGSNVPQSFRVHFNERAKDPASNIKLLNVQNDNFPNSEARTDLFAGEMPGQFEANSKTLQGQPVTVIQSLTDNGAENVNEISFKLLTTIRNLKRYGAGEITVAMPFAAFARQDREFPDKHASVMADDFPFFLKAAGADRIITAEVHSKAAENFYIDHFGKGNVTFLSFTEAYAKDVLAVASKANLVVGAPDGADKPEDAGIRRAHKLGETVWGSENDAQYFKIWKKRNGSDTKLMGFEGDVQGRVAVTIDDMSDSGGTCINAAKAQKEHGAAQTRVYLTHGLFNEKSLNRILTEKAANGTPAIDALVVADTVPGLSEKFAAAATAHPGRTTAVNVAPAFEREMLRPYKRAAAKP